MKITVLFVLVLANITSLAQSAENNLTPREAVKQMGRGINLGNTLEPPDEGGWNNDPAREYYFDDYKKAGFNFVRIPITWDRHVSLTRPPSK